MLATRTCILAACLLPATGVMGGEPSDHSGPGSQYVSCELLLPSRTLAAGATTTIGVRFRIKEPWHLYWNGQNDSGAAPTLDFSPSDPRLTFGPALWPVPTRHVAEGDIVDHIYERECVMLVPLTVSPGIGGEVTISLRSDIVVCSEACLPGRVGTGATIGIGAEAGPATPAAAEVAKAKADLPREVTQATPFESRLEGGTLIIETKAGRALRRLTFMPGPGCEASMLLPDCESRSESGGMPRLRVALTTARASGIVQSEDEQGQVANWRLDLPEPRVSDPGEKPGSPSGPKVNTR